jgi:general secretion pathway protein L
MSSLPASLATQKFFGMDLASFWRDLRSAWRGMLEWRVLAWLWPEIAVRLWLPGGAQALCRNIKAAHTADEAGSRAARFEAVLLPEDLLLRRTLTLPRLQPADLQAALALEVQSLSPFQSDDTVWAHCSGSLDASSCQVHLVLSARKLITQYLAMHYSHLKVSPVEVWVSAQGGPGYLVMPGFGGAMRARRGAMWRGASAALCLLLLALVTALAVTPSVQLYLRALQANHALMLLQKKIGPVVAHRESLMRATEQLDSLAKLVGQPVPVLQTLDLVTRALPDDTSLLSFKVNGLKVSISGQTGNSAALMKQLGATPGLKDVKAPTAAVKPLGAARESFSIEFMLSPEQLGSTP